MNKKYWLRGGVIGIIVGFLLLKTPLIYLISYPISFIVKLAINNFDFLLNGNGFIFYTAVITYSTVFIGMFFVGSIFGWIYGKLKNRDSSLVPKA